MEGSSCSRRFGTGIAMVVDPAPPVARARSRKPARAFTAGAVLLAVAGTIWWGWDSNPGWGKICLAAGGALTVVGVVLVRRRGGAISSRVLTAVAAILIVVALAQILDAI